MPLNYPADGRFDGLLGLHDNWSQLMQRAMPLQNLGISQGVASIIKMNSLSQLMMPPQNWLAAMKPAIPNLASLSGISSLAAFGDQLASMRTLDNQMSIARQLNSQMADWQQLQQRLTTSFSALASYQQVALSPWVLQAQNLQQLFANLKIQLDELDPEALEEAPDEEPAPAWQADFSSLTQQLTASLGSATAATVTTAGEVAAMRGEIRALTALAQRQLDYMEQARATEKSPFQVALRVFNIIGIVWMLISIVAFISDRLPKAVAPAAPAAAQAPATAPADRPATAQELQSLRAEATDSLFAVSSRTNQVRTTTARTQLRATPRPNAAGLGRVLPGTTVVVQQTHRKWALVIAQRPGQPPQQGWLLKKHLSRHTRPRR